MRKYTDVYRGEDEPKVKDVLWVHHSKYNDLQSGIIAEVYSKGKWVPLAGGGSNEGYNDLHDIILDRISAAIADQVIQEREEREKELELNTPLTFEAKANNTKIYFLTDCPPYTCSIDISTDDGETWSEVTSIEYGEGEDISHPIATLNIGEKIIVRGDNPSGLSRTRDIYGSQQYSIAGFFVIDGEAYVYGNIMSLLSKDRYTSLKSVPKYSFYRFFSGHGTLSNNEHSLFFHPTKKLLLPATRLSQGCYSEMFSRCAELTTAPELPATTLASHCYEYMFQNCTGLTIAPELPATTLAQNCYNSMFYGCTSLTTAPDLPATTLVSNCYGYMFYSCTSLNYIKALFATTPSNLYTNHWVENISATGTFVKNNAATWDVTGIHGVPTGWTVETTSA